MNHFSYVPLGFDPYGNPYYSNEVEQQIMAEQKAANPKKGYNIKLILLGVALIIGLVLYLTRVVKDNHSEVMMSFDEMADLINVRA